MIDRLLDTAEGGQATQGDVDHTNRRREIATPARALRAEARSRSSSRDSIRQRRKERTTQRDKEPKTQKSDDHGRYQKLESLVHENSVGVGRAVHAAEEAARAVAMLAEVFSRGMQQTMQQQVAALPPITPTVPFVPTPTEQPMIAKTAEQMHVQSPVAAPHDAAPPTFGDEGVAAPSNHGVSSQPPPTTAKPWEETLLQEVQTVLPKAVLNHLDRCAKRFEKMVERKLATEAHIEKEKRDISVMEASSNASEGNRRYPPGTRPFKSPSSFSELDTPWYPCSEEDYKWSVVIPKGSSKRDAMSRLHHTATMAYKTINRQALEEHLAMLAPQTTKEAFWRACNEWQDPDTMMDSLGLDDPCRPLLNSTLAASKATDLYRRVVDGVRRRKQKERDELEKEKRIKEEQEDKVANSRPSDLLKSAITDIVDSTLRAQGINQTVPEVSMDPDKPSAVVRFCDAVNPASPSEASSDSKKQTSKAKNNNNKKGQKVKKEINKKGKGKDKAVKQEKQSPVSKKQQQHKNGKGSANADKYNVPSPKSKNGGSPGAAQGSTSNTNKKHGAGAGRGKGKGAPPVAQTPIMLLPDPSWNWVPGQWPNYIRQYHQAKDQGTWYKNKGGLFHQQQHQQKGKSRKGKGERNGNKK